MSCVLAIPDLHFPFAHRDWFAFLAEVKKKYRPDNVVCLGDEADMYAISDYDHEPDAPSGGDEHEAMMEEMRRLYSLFSEVRSCISNHTSRPYRRAIKCGIPRVYMKEYREWMAAPRGWEWVDHIEIDGVRYFHGEGYSGAQGALKAASAHMQPVVIGHLHSFAGVLFSANPKHLFYGMNAGCLIDRDRLAFAYGKHMPVKPILGCGIIRDGVPMFRPMGLTRHHGWDGLA